MHVYSLVSFPLMHDLSSLWSVQLKHWAREINTSECVRSLQPFLVKDPTKRLDLSYRAEKESFKQAVADEHWALWKEQTHPNMVPLSGRKRLMCFIWKVSRGVCLLWMFLIIKAYFNIEQQVGKKIFFACHSWLLQLPLLDSWIDYHDSWNMDITHAGNLKEASSPVCCVAHWKIVYTTNMIWYRMLLKVKLSGKWYLKVIIENVFCTLKLNKLTS